MAAGGRSTDPRIGTVLKDKWRVDARLGRGGVATVYSATHRNGNKVAIKVLNREVARNADIRSRFLREGYAANAVAHPGVVRVLDDDTTMEGEPFLVLDLLTGELADARRMRLGGRLPLIEVLRIGDQVLDVLAAAHEKGIIHRDIKPENLFLCETGEVRVLDFGIARMRQAAAAEMTATGMLLGTPEFMSPEQAHGIQGEVDWLTDIWATGATLFTLLSGEAVHEALNTTAQILAAISRPARSLGAVTRDVPQPVIAVVDRALAFDKRARWPSARAMQRALAEAGRGVLTGESEYARTMRQRPVVDMSNVQGPISEDDRTIARVRDDDATAAADSEALPTNRARMRSVHDYLDESTVAEDRAPVSPPTRTDVSLAGPTPRARPDVVPISEDQPTRVLAGYDPARDGAAPTYVSNLPADMMQTLPVGRMLQEQQPRGGRPHPFGAPDDDAGPASKTSVMPSPPVQPGPHRLSPRATAPLPPESMGGFLLKRNPGPSASETPTVTTRDSSKTWTTIALVVGFGALALWGLVLLVLHLLSP